ncbi:MAG: chromate transporter [Alistipes sp.]|nr:chromate transporter [Alistipes sp.]
MRQLSSLFWSFFKIGLFTFGGGYAMIPLIEREVIDKRRWIERKDFLDLLTVAQSAPGPISLNTSVFVGYKMRGYAGATAAIAGVILPSFAIILVIAMFFADIRNNPVVDAAFKGMRPAVVALIIAPVIGLTRGMKPPMILIAAAVAGAIWYFGIPPVPLLIAGAAAGLLYTICSTRKISKG